MNPIGLTGGMALFWNDQFKLTVDRFALEFCDVICIDLIGGLVMILLRNGWIRALCNLEWRLALPEAELFALLTEPDCRDVVAWSWTSTRPQVSGLPLRLKAVSSALTQWSISKFSKGHHQLAALNQQLLNHANQTFHPYDASLDDTQAWVHDPSILKKMMTDYFSNLYQTVGHRDYWPILQQCPQVITNEMNTSLKAPVTKKEDELFLSVQQFFLIGVMPPVLNKTVISLIPKQGAFVSGRQIQDNILIIQEVLHQLKVRKCRRQYRAILKMDMQKAYDRVEWDFLKDYLFTLGFHATWVQWIMQCITIVQRWYMLQRTGKYLGIPSDWGRSKRDRFAWTLGRVNAKLEGWKESLLSKGGKEILLKTVIQAIHQYAMSNEGLGFRDLQDFNKAMLGKQAWRLFHNPMALWSTLFKGLYFHSYDFMHVDKGSRPSWGWQSILFRRDSILPNLRWSVGNGQSINIREDRWLLRGIIGGPAPQNALSIVNELLHLDINRWNVPLLHQQFDASTVQDILKIQVRPHYTTDRVIWTGMVNGIYSVKNGYNTFRKTLLSSQPNIASSSYHPLKSLWKAIWAVKLPPKIRPFLWSVCHNALATKDNLFNRRIITDPTCPLCSTLNPETTEHLFLLCSWTRRLWSHSHINIPINQQSITRMDAWLIGQIEQRHNYPDLELIASLLWHIWKARNQFIFRQQCPDHLQVIDLAFAQVRTAKITNQLLQRATRSCLQLDMLWRPPKPGMVKINIDGAYYSDSVTGAMASIHRDHFGNLLHGFTYDFPTTSALQSETQALTITLDHLLSKGKHQNQLIIESDCLMLVQAIQDPTTTPWEMRSLLAEVTGARGLGFRPSPSFLFFPAHGPGPVSPNSGPRGPALSLPLLLLPCAAPHAHGEQRRAEDGDARGATQWPAGNQDGWDGGAVVFNAAGRRASRAGRRRDGGQLAVGPASGKTACSHVPAVAIRAYKRGGRPIGREGGGLQRSRGTRERSGRWMREKLGELFAARFGRDRGGGEI
ncbi:uncharacterized protein [Rutidosis leptorrhynchoides]|uniref:uncharacterized protein n=1 Tax=Rutidosis leptorrhynchoides TaxID=125765 RepID=UPI003A98CF98